MKKPLLEIAKAFFLQLVNQKAGPRVLESFLKDRIFAIFPYIAVLNFEDLSC